MPSRLVDVMNGRASTRLASRLFTLSSAAVAPVVASIAPDFGSTLGDTIDRIIVGTGFTGATAVKFGVTDAASFTVNSDTQITARVPAKAAGQYDVSVTTPGGTDALEASYDAIAIALWLYAHADYWVLSGSNIVTWACCAGTGLSITQATGTKQPLVATGINGKATASHDGTADTLGGAFTFPAQHDIILLRKTTAGTRIYSHNHTADASPSRYLYTPGGGPNSYYRTPGLAINSRNAASFAAHPAGAEVLGVRFGGSNASHIISSNGVDYSMSNVSATETGGIVSAGTFHLFSYMGGSEYVAGDIAQLIITGDDCSVSVRAKITNYLRTYGATA